MGAPEPRSLPDATQAPHTSRNAHVPRAPTKNNGKHSPPTLPNTVPTSSGLSAAYTSERHPLLACPLLHADSDVSLWLGECWIPGDVDTGKVGVRDRNTFCPRNIDMPTDQTLDRRNRGLVTEDNVVVGTNVALDSGRIGKTSSRQRIAGKDLNVVVMLEYHEYSIVETRWCGSFCASTTPNTQNWVFTPIYTGRFLRDQPRTRVGDRKRLVELPR
ncbi:hypothetical protein K438DRAFT_1943889 [Mycena galopus ATCC 62051]|nr:hypothetical protein K438DRAFT_1943889 [Mycena galopus ATCC 62051]